jgi:2'-5' RNA ligase
MTQIALPGFEATPVHAVFFALFPPEDTAVQLLRHLPHLRDEHGLTGQPVKAERLHITLYYLGDHEEQPKRTVAMARDAMANIAMPPFDVVLDRVTSFRGKPGNNPLVLTGGDGLAGVIALQQFLDTALVKGRPIETPHMTLLYDERLVEEQAVEAAIRWTARELVLVQSVADRTSGHQRTRHVPLARWPLRG